MTSNTSNMRRVNNTFEVRWKMFTWHKGWKHSNLFGGIAVTGKRVLSLIFFFDFFFFLNMSETVKSLNRNQKESNTLSVNVFWCTISSWIFFHKQYTTDLTYLNILVEKTLMIMIGQMCGNYLSIFFFLVPFKDINIYNIFDKIQT